jgi:hypothetical protein
VRFPHPDTLAYFGAMLIAVLLAVIFTMAFSAVVEQSESSLDGGDVSVYVPQNASGLTCVVYEAKNGGGSIDCVRNATAVQTRGDPR